MTLSNWNDSARCTPATVAAPRDMQELIDIVRDVDGRFPSPVRAIGSLHSLNACFTTSGTAVLMKNFDRRDDPDLGSHTVTVGAGVRMIDLKNHLKRWGLQIPVVPEIGNATAGSVACCGTKDASLPPSDLGQISSTVVRLKLVDPSGAVVEVPSSPSGLSLEAVRSSYGLLGIVFEVTFHVQPRTLVKYGYEALSLEPLPPIATVLGGADGFLGFLLPYRRQLIVERRVRDLRIPDTIWNKFKARFALMLRTVAWTLGARPFQFPALLPRALTRQFLKLWVWCLDHALRWFFLQVLGSSTSYRADAMIDFKRRRSSYFDFTFWAFPKSTWGTVVPAYLDFCERFLSRTGFRPALPTEVYFIRHDPGAWLSFSWDEDIFTLDMVNWTDYYPAEWRAMNNEFNEFAARHGGRPLFNQTKHPAPAVIAEAMRTNPNWRSFLQLRERMDRGGRFLTAFFRELLPSP
jgi:hypothetical protein